MEYVLNVIQVVCLVLEVDNLNAYHAIITIFWIKIMNARLVCQINLFTIILVRIVNTIVKLVMLQKIV